MSMTRDAFLGLPKRPPERVDLPELGDGMCVYVRRMTSRERDDFETAIMERRGKVRELNHKNLRARLVALCTVDEHGNRLFTDADAEALGDKEASIIDPIFAAAQRINALSQRDVEELEKNSEKTRGESSTAG